MTTIIGVGLILNFCGPDRGWHVLTEGIFCCRAPTLFITNFVNTPPGEGRAAICLSGGIRAFRVVTLGFEVVLMEDVVLGADVVGTWTDGVPEALDATLEITVLRVEISSTVGRSLPVT